jgi:hypothetical protein
MPDPKPVRADDIIDRIPILDTDIMQVAADQPMLFIDAARYRVTKMRKVNESNAKVEYQRAFMMMRLRNKKHTDQSRVTEASLREKVDTSQEILDLRAEHERSREQDEFAKLILEAMRYRSKAIQIIADAQQYEGRSGAADVERIEQRRKLANEARKLHRERERVDGDDVG